MNTYSSDKIQSLLKRLHADARATDEAFIARYEQMTDAERESIQSDHKRFYGLARDAYLPVGEDLGRLLYLLVRSTRAKSLVEFGTSFGLSTIYLAAALRDNGGGRLVTYELEPSKSQRAQIHLAEAGLSDFVDFQIGDALDLLAHGPAAPVDFLLLDGAKPLYLQILKLLEPRLQSGALIAADNINTRHQVNAFTDYIRTPGNGYVSVDMPLGDGIELSVRV